VLESFVVGRRECHPMNVRAGEPVFKRVDRQPSKAGLLKLGRASLKPGEDYP
jgi:hypothetical protein